MQSQQQSNMLTGTIHLQGMTLTPCRKVAWTSHHPQCTWQGRNLQFFSSVHQFMEEKNTLGQFILQVYLAVLAALNVNCISWGSPHTPGIWKPQLSRNSCVGAEWLQRGNKADKLCPGWPPNSHCPSESPLGLIGREKQEAILMHLYY